MGFVESCCKRPPEAAVDPRTALRAGGRIRAARNETEDPRAPLLTKRRDEPSKPLKLDPDMEAFVDILSTGSDDQDDGDDDDFAPPAKRD
jgi:hypothetical protein